MQEHKSSARWLQIILDLVLVVGLLYLHTTYKGPAFDSDYRSLAILVALLMSVIYHANGVYKLNTSLYDRFMCTARSWATVLALIVLAGFVTKTSASYSREVLLTWSVTGFIAQLLSFLGIRYLQASANGDVIPTLVVGTTRLGQHLASYINKNTWIPDQVLGFISIDTAPIDDEITLPVIGDINQIKQIIQDKHIRRLYLALPLDQVNLIQPLYLELTDRNVDIIWAPDIYSIELLNHSVRELGGVPIISLSETPLIGSSAFIKSMLDVSIASIALIVTAPLMLITALLIKLGSPGPVFFTQKRHGWDGEIITIYKFRSMKQHEEESGTVTQASESDDRVTWIGRIIRRTSIDELPQLFNVIDGSMSIVGPRPHAVAHNKFYGERIKDYMQRHRIKPGITGLAQVNGFRGETQEIELMEGRVQQDLAYINNWSIWLDLKIMIRTVFVLLDKKAY